MATQPDGPEPKIRALADGEAEVAFVVDRVRELLADEVPAREVAVLVRLNAQVEPFEAAFSGAGIPYQVRGQHFFDRREVRTAVRALEPPAGRAGGRSPGRRRCAGPGAEELGFDPRRRARGARGTGAARGALDAAGDRDRAGRSGDAESPGAGSRDAVLAELAQRAEGEARGDVDGVALLTLHRAKGLEWDAVFIPSLEEGLLPVAQAGDDEEALAEERRLLYVGITRARSHLALSWARQRTSATGRPQRRTMSRFLAPLGGAAPRPGVARSPRAARPASGRPVATDGLASDDLAILEALRSWRRDRAAADAVPAYVVATDATLRAVVERRPRTFGELLGVPGIGPAKVEKYGPDILDVLAGSMP